ncbi:putative secreted protein [Sphingobium sp. B1D3A]|uniref:Secreted protein n=1 Tax=Sphingobium lignivorans TaxID=2735886 RepID=A0ABR6NEC7_9SPHN|nr:putative secreted protein [Sphingobium lignivorans]
MTFGHALKLYDRSKLIAEQDTKGKWKTRIAAISKRMRAYDPEFIPDDALLPLMRFLFPEVEKNTSAYLDKFLQRGT